jgi:hypothetical protein
MSEADTFGQALELAGSLYSTAYALQADQPATLARLRAELAGGQTRQALLLLANLHPDYTVALADPLATRALSHRDALLVRQVFGRLPHHEAVDVVPAAVWRQLGRTADDDAYRRLAELLDHLGLDDALRELAEAALRSDDPAIREVGEEFHPDHVSD